MRETVTETGSLWMDWGHAGYGQSTGAGTGLDWPVNRSLPPSFPRRSTLFVRRVHPSNGSRFTYDLRRLIITFSLNSGPVGRPRCTFHLSSTR